LSGYDSKINRFQKKRYFAYQHVKVELGAGAEDTAVLQSAGAVSKLLQTTCLYASEVREPEYRTPLMNSIGDDFAWLVSDAVSSAFSRVMPSVPVEQVSIFALSMEWAAMVSF
jgi:hypothetical protein